MIVADTNLIAYLLIEGDRTASAEAVFTKDSAWIMPRLWRSEFRNVLVLQVRSGHLELEDAVLCLVDAELRFGAGERPVDSEAALRLALEAGCSAYDAEFVHIARTLAVPLVTSDTKVLKLFPDVAVSPEDFIGRRDGERTE